jgi:DNA-binding response OmpR family regulator
LNELVLAVDDNTRILDLVTLVLRQAGYRIATAASGAEARQKLVEEPPALIILDMSLPDISGMELLRSFRETSDVPVIILSALEQAAGKAGKIPGVRFVSKPFDPRELINHVKQAMGPV